MKKFSIIVFLLLCSACASERNPVAPVKESPISCDATAQQIFSELEEESIMTLRETAKNDLIMFHFSWGMGIRNSYGLWSEDSEIRKSCAKEVGQDDIHPDNASSIIMEKVWALVNTDT